MGVFDFLKKKKKKVVIPEGFGTSQWETETPIAPPEPAKESAYAKFKAGMGTAANKVDETAHAAGEAVVEDYDAIKRWREQQRLEKLRNMATQTEELKAKNELAAQKASLRTKGEDTWGQVARTASRGQSVVKGLKTVLTMGGPVSPKRMELYVPKAKKGLYYDAESTRSLTLPGGDQEKANGGLRAVSTPKLGMLRQAGAPPSRQPKAGLSKPQGPNYAALRASGGGMNFSMLRDITFPKGLSKIEKTAVGEIQIHQGNPLEVLSGLRDAGYTRTQGESAIKKLALRGVVKQGSDKTLELVEVQK